MVERHNASGDAPFRRARVTVVAGVAGQTSEEIAIDADAANHLAKYFPKLEQSRHRRTAVATPPSFVILFERRDGSTEEALVYDPVDPELARYLAGFLNPKR